MIKEYGFNTFFEEQLSETEKEMIKGRITIDYGNGFEVITEQGTFKAIITGKLRYESERYPVIGDFVLMEKADAKTMVIHKVLERSTSFKRKVAGNEFKEQVQGANFDYMFIVSSMNKDLNLRKLERYIITGWDTGATPVIVLTKADLAHDIESIKEDIEAISFGVKVHCISSLYQINIEELDDYLTPGSTIALFGASGVGKSTLINTLAGETTMKVNTIREDDARGRHTTTHRQLIMLPNGTLIMDTPGMREIGIWDDGSGVDQTFEDITLLESKCKFRNCSHNKEPGCAIKSAIETGELSAKRYDSYIKLKKEAAYNMRKAEKKERLAKSRH